MSEAAATQGQEIDATMERASAALLETRYHEAASLSRSALGATVDAGDYERASRIVLPLQEARRQIRQIAVDAGLAGGAWIIEGRAPAETRSGLYLCTPDAAEDELEAFRKRLHDAGAFGFLVRVCETGTEGWTLCGLPDRGPHKLVMSPGTDIGAGEFPPVAWFEGAAEAIGDAAIKAVPKGMEPADRVRRLLSWLDTMPEHEKLHQRLAEAARDAARGPATE